MAVAPQLRLSIGKTILIHELRQSGIEVDFDAVTVFVQNDLRSHQTVAAAGYLSIVQAIDRARDSTSAISSLHKELAGIARWEWCSVDSVAQTDDAIVICGGINRVDKT